MAKKAKTKSDRFASCSDGKEGCYSRGEVDPKSREKHYAGKKGQEEIFPALTNRTTTGPTKYTNRGHQSSQLLLSLAGN